MLIIRKIGILALLVLTALSGTACSQSDSKKDSPDGDQSRQPKIVDKIKPEEITHKEPPSKKNGILAEDIPQDRLLIEKNKPSVLLWAFGNGTLRLNNSRARPFYCVKIS